MNLKTFDGPANQVKIHLSVHEIHVGTPYRGTFVADSLMLRPCSEAKS